MSGEMTSFREIEVKIFLWFFILLLIFVSVAHGFFMRDIRQFYDFSSYGFPCAAGVFAGGAIYLSREAERKNRAWGGADHYYKISVLFLYLGFIFYCLSHPCSSPNVVIISFATQIICTVVLILRVRLNKDSDENDYTVVIFSGVALLGVAVILFFTFSDLFPITGSWRCYPNIF